MGFMDDMKDKAQNKGDIKERFDELRNMEMRGELDDKAKEELQELRKRFSGNKK